MYMLLYAGLSRQTCLKMTEFFRIENSRITDMTYLSVYFAAFLNTTIQTLNDIAVKYRMFTGSNKNEFATNQPRKLRLYYRYVLSHELLQFLLETKDDETTWEDIKHQKAALAIRDYFESKSGEHAYPNRPLETFLFLYPTYLKDKASQFLTRGKEQLFFAVDIVEMTSFAQYQSKTNHWCCLKEEFSFKNAYHTFRTSTKPEDIFGSNIKKLQDVPNLTSKKRKKSDNTPRDLTPAEQQKGIHKQHLELLYNARYKLYAAKTKIVKYKKEIPDNEHTHFLDEAYSNVQDAITGIMESNKYLHKQLLHEDMPEVDEERVPQRMPGF